MTQSSKRACVGGFRTPESLNSYAATVYAKTVFALLFVAIRFFDPRYSMFNPDPSFVVPTTAPLSHLRLGDEAFIDITALRNVDYWTDALGVTETELRLAVAAVGDSAQDVRDHLGK
jgi:Protein of unknown function (DUF3606)